MAGMYKKLTNSAECVFTGKGLTFGGSLIRPESTGYGCVYFAEEMLATKGKSFKGLRVSISGSGNVAQYATEKCMALGAKVVTVSDSSGTIVDEDQCSISNPISSSLTSVHNNPHRKHAQVCE